MNSKSRKAQFLSPGIAMQQRYVRVPFQKYRNIYELKTDVNFERLFDRFNSLISILSNWTPNEIYRIQADTVLRSPKWFETYRKMQSAYRTLNSTRTLRRMQITGFRLCNISCPSPHVFQICTDTYVTEQLHALTLFDFILNTNVPAGQETIDVAIEFDGGLRDRRLIIDQATSYEDWNRRAWSLHDCEQQKHYFQIRLHAPTSDVVPALGLLLDTPLGGRGFRSAKCRYYNLTLDRESDTPESYLRQRYGATDINVLLSPHRYRTIQTFGRLHQTARK